jgi:hypothetical protein
MQRLCDRVLFDQEKSGLTSDSGRVKGFGRRWASSVRQWQHDPHLGPGFGPVWLLSAHAGDRI